MKIKLKKLLVMNWPSKYISEGKTKVSCWPFKHSLKEMTHTGPLTGHLNSVHFDFFISGRRST